MEKVVFLLDYANINRSGTDRGLDLDYKDLYEYIAEGRFLIDAYCYVPIDPRYEHQMDKTIEDLCCFGYLVTSKIGNIAGDTYKCDFDVEMTMDILKIAHNVKPDIIVIATGDADFIPVIVELRRMGIRVEIACFEWAVSRKVLLQSSGFIDLSMIFNKMEVTNFPHVSFAENETIENDYELSEENSIDK